MLEGIAEAAGGNALYDALLSHTPSGRIAEAADIAEVALFLASEDSNVLTGGEDFADGGMAQV
ncbi:SDR family oxidoreductase [Halodurantibacterium flavum]|uniref:SDR family oxidoreductase n=1 Tax=Halodurantibacterium flavum TaxID=1382802 RepID=A0ABW4S350_9RHOB